MPKAPEWLNGLEAIIPKVEALPEDVETLRKDVEVLLGVKRTEASRIMQNAGARLVGHEMKLRADSLLAYLRNRYDREFQKEKEARRRRPCRVVKKQEELSFKDEAERRKRFGKWLKDAMFHREEFPHAQIEAPEAIALTRFEHLADFIQLEPGLIVMEFQTHDQQTGLKELKKKMLLLAMAIGNQPEEFLRAIGLAGEPEPDLLRANGGPSQPANTSPEEPQSKNELTNAVRTSGRH
jgi:hypothetical protein